MSELSHAAAAPMPGNSTAMPPTFSEEQIKQLAQQDLVISATFARIVSVLMRSQQHRHMSLADLEWLVMPPLLLGQFAVLEGKVEGVPYPVPAAVAFWAKVSHEVDRRLEANIDAPMSLRPEEWRSGDILWLIEAAGAPAAMPQLLAQLRKSVFRAANAKMRIAGRAPKNASSFSVPA